MQNYRNLKVWRKSLALASTTYAATDQLPTSERYSLATQMQRSANSIASNIAEGSGRGSDADFARFLRMSFGSACELETQALIAIDCYPSTESSMRTVVAGSEEVRRMLGALIRRLTTSS